MGGLLCGIGFKTRLRNQENPSRQQLAQIATISVMRIQAKGAIERIRGVRFNLPFHIQRVATTQFVFVRRKQSELRCFAFKEFGQGLTNK